MVDATFDAAYVPDESILTINGLPDFILRDLNAGTLVEMTCGVEGKPLTLYLDPFSANIDGTDVN